MYENDFDMNQMEFEPGADPGNPDGEFQEGVSMEPDAAQTEETTFEEGGATSDPEEFAEEEIPEEKPKRSRRKKKEDEPESGEKQPEPAFNEESADESGDGPDELDGDGEPVDEGDVGQDGDEPDDSEPQDDTARPVRRRRASGDTVLDERGRAIEHRATMDEGLKVLTYASARHVILTGTVDGIENDGNAHPRVVFYVGGVKVLIPFKEMGFDLNPDEVDVAEAGRRIDAMLGAKIDYMVRHVDVANRIAAASRKDAMLLRQRTILNARSGDDYRIREGMKCTARVVQVSRLSLLVEVYGFQTYIRRDSISNIWVHDIRDVVRVGEEKPVTIMQLTRDEETGEVIRLVVSMREAEKAVETELRAGNSYTGAVSGFSESAYFVKIMGVPVEVRCPIRSNHILETLDMGDTVKVVIRGLSDRGGYIGSIRKMIKKAESSLF